MAVRHISLRDFVIVRELELELAAGFSVLTGETGAGKSILIDALQLALGARADPAWVREEAPRAEVCVEFETPGHAMAWLDECGFEASETLLLRRTVDAQGRSRGWINGSPATAAQLREIGDRLVDIHGQHAWQSLTRPAAVRSLLDAYAGLDTTPLQRAWGDWRAAQEALQVARSDQERLQQERDRLLWQIAELDKLAPGTDEWPGLNADHLRLSNAQSLIDAASGAIEHLEADAAGALSALARAGHDLQAVAHLDPALREVGEVLASSLAQAEDAAHSLHAWLRRADIDPQRLAEVDARMGQWISLARRFKRPPDELAALHAEWKAALERLDAASDLAALEKTESRARQAWTEQARQVSRARSEAAPRLATAVTSAMQGLGMAGGRFEVALQTLDEPASHGLEDVAFLVAGHAGSTPRPVGKVASGGELSRIALAIAVTTSRLGEAPTLIFDEVDAGVGGAVAETVGRLMRQLGRDRQVLAVTHLPQVAACADHHLLVSKQADSQGKTLSRVDPVQGEARTREIARMLGGERLSATTLAHAQEMLMAGPDRRSPESSNP